MPHDLRKDPALRGHDKAVLLAAALLEYARDKPSCWPSNRRLAEDLGCSPRTVQLALAALRRAGWIRVEQGADGRRIWLTWREADCAPSPSPVAPDRAQAVAPELRREGEEERPSSDSCSGSTPPPAGEKGETVASADELAQLVEWARGSDPVLAKIGRAALAMAGVVEPIVADVAPEPVVALVEPETSPAATAPEASAPSCPIQSPRPATIEPTIRPSHRAATPSSRRRGPRHVLESFAGQDLPSTLAVWMTRSP